MGTSPAQPARLSMSLPSPPPQQLILPLWPLRELAGDPPWWPAPNEDAGGVLPHQVWTQLSPTEQRQIRRALLQVLQEVQYDSARHH
jgi:hypothetical protein